jgi:hypothetical protein
MITQSELRDLLDYDENTIESSHIPNSYTK